MKTKYPILLVHGMGFRDRKILNYWGRIPKVLTKNGYTVYYGNQDANGTIESNAIQLKKTIEELANKTGKVNVIAHSKGGLDIRYAVSNLGIEEKVASVTTVATPHNGSKTMDRILKLPDILVRYAAKVVDIIMKVCGDSTPDSYRVFHEFSTEHAEKFNKDNPDKESVYYQSYAFIMKKMFSDILLWFPYIIVKVNEGANDGLLAPHSVKWGNFRGVYTATGSRGISHCDEVDLRRKRFTRRKSTSEMKISDITQFYLEVVNELAKKGF